MKPLHRSPHRPGFTLVELLIVIAIIAILAGLSIPVTTAVMEKARRAEAKQACTEIVKAIGAFEHDYGHLPDFTDADTTPGAKTDNAVMNVLLGKESKENTREKRYTDLSPAKGGDSLAGAFAGLHETDTDAHLFDPWKKTGDARYYRVLLDSDLDGKIGSPVGGKDIFGKKVLVWSLGPDGKYESSNPLKGKNEDNIYSWRHD